MAENEYVVSIEELSARKVVKRVGSSQPSGPSHDQQQQQPISSSTWKEKLKKMLEDDERAQNLRIPAAAKPKIQRVPPMLRDQKNFVKYYEPRAVCIGPIHHGNPKFQVSSKYKPKLTAKFIKDSGSTNGGEDLYMKIWDSIKELRDCYEEEVTKSYDDETLAWMLFLDGCSTLQFIHSYQVGELKKCFNIKNDQISFAQQDLFLLENQLPYRVLKLLMNVGSKINYKDSIIKFVRNNVMAPEKLTHKIVLKIEEEEEPAHLLELLQFALLYKPQKKKEQQMYERGCENKESYNSQHSYRNVQELKTAGIQLKPSGSCCLRDVTFNSLCFAGYLKIPPLTVDDSTGPLFFNLIAYEMLPDNIQTDYGVTSYISFLDQLIDNADDVKDLRSANVLRNHLGSDLEVAELFNEIGTDLVPDPHAYTKVKAQLQKHYKNKWMTWMAQVYYEHFSNPWTIMAFNAAMVALALSSVQTWFAVFSPPGPCDKFCSNFTMPHKP
ncbi:hypothetical protein FNV43_RR16410 [Rhamnella rubrinervis]|uniref:Uncharacterized protein n=1 Tax=Rhamnella rubrinervis TaxID=2594499 RepID=A0A8K0GYR5_9ROSA|nr:hypothetical protein FNV43_RR16410 [Rhamnella rubrinervis]